MKKVIAGILLTFVCFILQTTIFQHIQLANVAPNFLLVITVAIGYMYGRAKGAVTGFFCGLATDMMFGNVIGVKALIFMIIGYFNGYANKIYYGDDFSVPLILIAISDFIYGFLYYVCMFLLRGRLNFLYYLRRIIVPEIVYTVFIGIILYKLIYWLDLKLTAPVEEVRE